MKISEQGAFDLASRLLEAHGAPPEHAALQARALVEAELKGHPSHGLLRLPRLLARIDRGLLAPGATGLHHWTASARLDVEGEDGFGPVVAMTAIRQLEQRVSQTGIAVAAVRNSNHLGMLAWYVEQVAAGGRIGIAMSSSEALVHPHGGTRALLGTNPIAIAVPTAGSPLVLDLATSIVSMGKIHHHAAMGQPIPEGWALDASGQPTTDPVQARAGALTPFGAAKGYGLGIAIELWVAAMAGSALAPDVRGTLDADAVCNKGDVLIVIEPADSPDLLARLADYLDVIRASPSADARSPVRVPGDLAQQRRSEALMRGFDLDPALWAELQALDRSTSLNLEG
ncbi:Ldh family oxidoreductase [Variovorax ginsengisoli]|uniref:Ldh family oxidoreductase n=1 Tax=Variovorax ginsengisoli TaxID=363844 RepID=A0ABT8SH99_9BURK|nr:Ldh family oxidoreductase [Variovorax ginsengisoli]MDN8618212.1 Ldh family oxidoreductase [Variovorax ginsengisoli]MDO1537382.1 Ldh family oxidoreductase [Variovorax ginsengisoli]